ncbi:MAG: hypothetical protein ACKVOE_03790 [Rickettsiales bacterium]
MPFTTSHSSTTSDHNHLTNQSFADHEPGLWRAVITQALMDAASQSHKSEARRSRDDAIRWLMSDTSDFETVCDNAGLDPDYVRGRAIQALGRGCTWRLPAGLGWRTQARAVLSLTPASQH